MKNLLLISLLGMFSCLIAGFSYANKQKVNILPLGDSITCASKYKLSYRYPLWKKLIDAGKTVEFVGSHAEKGDFGRQHWERYKGFSFPARHECHSGWRTDQILKGAVGKGGLSQWLLSYRVDIALIHLGTNDLYQLQTPESTRDEIEQVILTLRKKNFRVKVLLAQILPMRIKQDIPRLNQLLIQLARKLDKPASPVKSVDMYTGFRLDSDFQKDKIHPNGKGEEKMAQRWLSALSMPQMLGK